jgi:hypothetical protein
MRIPRTASAFSAICFRSWSILAHAAIPAIMAAAAVPAAAQCSGFSLASSGGASIVPGTTDISNHCDDCVTSVPLPFPITLYGATYSAANVSSNGTFQFTTASDSYANGCLPQAGTLGVAICPHWDDLLTSGPNEGIFTSISGSAPRRVFNVEWRAHYYSGGGSLNFELRLFEDQSGFEVIFGRIDEGGSSATVGIEHTSLPPTQFSCNTAGLITPGTRLRFTCYDGPTGIATTFPNPVNACGTQGTTLLTVNVTPGTSPPSTGISVRADLTSIGGNSNQVFYNDATHGDAAAGDGIWSFQFMVPQTVSPGDKSVPYTLSDSQGRSTTGVIGLTVNPCPSIGPDVIVANLTDINYYGAVGNISAYSIGTNACNIGDVPVTWIQGGTQHPLIAQNFYRLKGGRFEQIGQSFLKHSFQSLNSPSDCGHCTQPPMGGAQLGVGCSDVYGAGYNGGQGNLGPRSTCNATTGVFVWPPPPAASNDIGQRLQVFTDDIDPALNAGALYFGEAQYVTADDAQWTYGGAPSVNGLNNASYQMISFTSTTAAPAIVGAAHRMVPAIQAWKDVDPAVSIAVADYLDTSLPGPGIVCRFWVASKAINNGDGTWHYEYAVQNLNADRSGGRFSVPVGSNVTVRNIDFHGVFAHSGEPFPNTAATPDKWTGVVTPTAITWTCPEPFIAPSGNNANALRWGTLYNFRFDANIAPVAGPAAIGLFKPGTPTTTSAAGLSVPGLPCQGPSVTLNPANQVACPGGAVNFSVAATGTGPLSYQWRHGVPRVAISGATGSTYSLPAATAADADSYDCIITNTCGSATSNAANLTLCIGDFNCDGGVDGQDIESFFRTWSNGESAGDVNADGGVDGQDIEYFFVKWEAGC